LDGAKSAFSQAASETPGAAAPKYSLGCVAERMGSIQEALEAYRAAYTANPKYEGAVAAYALLLARQGHTTEAEQFLGAETRALPDSVGPTIALAEVKSIEGDSAGCQALAQQALTRQPDSKDAMLVVARDYFRAHKWELARYALQAILEGAEDGSIPPRDKGNPVALLLRALIERESGQRKQAIADLDLAVHNRPDLFEAYVNLGEMKLEAGNATEAQDVLEKAVRFGPSSAVAHLDLGDGYRLLGRPADSKKELTTALSLDSTLFGAHYDLGLLYLFSPSVPGMVDEDDQLVHAVQEFETYKAMHTARPGGGVGDDVDELLSTAKRKQSELQLKKQAAAAPPPAPTAAPSSSAAPAAPSATPAASSGSGGIIRDLPQ
jgi:tetratricopeptide (TPR) repeat protein